MEEWNSLQYMLSSWDWTLQLPSRSSSLGSTPSRSIIWLHLKTVVQVQKPQLNDCNKLSLTKWKFLREDGMVFSLAICMLGDYLHVFFVFFYRVYDQRMGWECAHVEPQTWNAGCSFMVWDGRDVLLFTSASRPCAKWRPRARARPAAERESRLLDLARAARAGDREGVAACTCSSFACSVSTQPISRARRKHVIYLFSNITQCQYGWGSFSKKHSISTVLQ